MPTDHGHPEETFAANMRKMRTARELSQDAFAQLMTQRGHKWHQATVYKVETGVRQIQLGEARAAADILGVSLDQMLRGTRSVQAVVELRALLSRIVAEDQRFMDAQSTMRVLQEDLQELFDSLDDDAKRLLSDSETDILDQYLRRGRLADGSTT